MPFDPQAVLRFKGVAVTLLGVLAAALGIWLVGSFGDYFGANPLYTPIPLTDALDIDVLGALVPIVAALIALLLFLRTPKAPLKLTVAFFVSLALAFLLCHITPEGIAGYPLLFALGTGIAATAVNVYPKPFANLKKSITFAITLTLACVPLSLFIVDLAYSPGFSGAVIGGKGLTDGLLLSTLYAPVAVTGLFFALSYASHMNLLLQAARSESKMSQQAKTGPVAS